LSLPPEAELDGPEQRQSPGHERDKRNRDVEPKGLNMLEFWSEVAFEVVLDDKDAEELGIAVSAKYVPGEGGQAETGDGQRVKAAESVTPTSGQDGPEEYGAAGKNDGGGSFGEDGETEKKAEEQQCQPGPPRR
jgi:hypothetical protein